MQATGFAAIWQAKAQRTCARHQWSSRRCRQPCPPPQTCCTQRTACRPKRAPDCETPRGAVGSSVRTQCRTKRRGPGSGTCCLSLSHRLGHCHSLSLSLHQFEAARENRRGQPRRVTRHRGRPAPLRPAARPRVRGRMRRASSPSPSPCEPSVNPAPQHQPWHR